MNIFCMLIIPIGPIRSFIETRGLLSPQQSTGTQLQIPPKDDLCILQGASVATQGPVGWSPSPSSLALTLALSATFVLAFPPCELSLFPVSLSPFPRWPARRGHQGSRCLGTGPCAGRELQAESEAGSPNSARIGWKG